jgi:hypothetical protein
MSRMSIISSAGSLLAAAAAAASVLPAAAAAAPPAAAAAVPPAAASSPLTAAACDGAAPVRAGRAGLTAGGGLHSASSPTATAATRAWAASPQPPDSPWSQGVSRGIKKGCQGVRSLNTPCLEVPTHRIAVDGGQRRKGVAHTRLGVQGFTIELHAVCCLGTWQRMSLAGCHWLHTAWQ